MIQSKYTFSTQEVQLQLPKQGMYNYTIESKNCMNYAKGIYCTRKNNISINIQYTEDQPYIRFLDIQVTQESFRFSDGSFAMQDIIKKTAAVFANLSLQLSYKGTIVGVDNMEELQALWRKTEAYLKSKYKGNQIERYISNMNTIVHSEVELIKELSLYHNLGGLLKSMYQKYNSDSFTIISQELATKYGKVSVSEEVLLQSVKDTGEIQLQLQAHHPENEEYLSINGTYHFTGEQESSLQQAVISCIEKYGRQEYYTSINITQL